jgi:septal ring factor EnvC (AmiA/AmiB activator)
MQEERRSPWRRQPSREPRSPQNPHNRPAALPCSLPVRRGRTALRHVTGTSPAAPPARPLAAALGQAAKTEKQLRASLKKHSKEISTAKDDLDKRDRDLKKMKSQLKTAKKSRKRATKKLSHTP